MNLTKINKPFDTKIEPSDINTLRHFWGSFGSYESEVSANWLVRLAQSAGYWKPFTKEEIETFYQAKGYRRFLFNGVDKYLIKDGALFFYTVQFVAKCYASAPQEERVA